MIGHIVFQLLSLNDMLCQFAAPTSPWTAFQHERRLSSWTNWPRPVALGEGARAARLEHARRAQREHALIAGRTGA